MQLLECCEEPLRKDLTRTTNDNLTDRSEEQLLSAIRLLAVRKENVMVSRVLLHQMRQDNGEAIRGFAARVKGQAHVCEYITNCHDCEKSISYSDTVVRDVLILGIADQDIQLELLGNADQNMSLENVIKYIETKEAGKRSASRLLQHAETAAAARTAATRNYKPPKVFQERPAEDEMQSAYTVERMVMVSAPNYGKGANSVQRLAMSARHVRNQIILRVYAEAVIKPWIVTSL